MTQVSEYYDRIAGEYHRQYDGTGRDYPANKIRLDIIVKRLKKLGVKSVYEIGVGEGTPLLTIREATGAKVTGCDISREMIEIARRTLGSTAIAYCDAEKEFHVIGDPYDAVIATGVLPHVQNDLMLFNNIKKLLREGGTTFIEFRNALFSLFTFNRHTVDFIEKSLLDIGPGNTQAMVRKGLRNLLGTELDTVSDFDAIAKFHNPFVLLPALENLGFDVRQIHWYHFHPAPPMYARYMGEDEFTRQALKMEVEQGWRGMFLASAGVVEAVKK